MVEAQASSVPATAARRYGGTAVGSTVRPTGAKEEVLSGLQVALDQFETAVEQGAAGRLTHIAATAELDTVAEEVVQIVDVMSGLIRVRFASQRELLVEWESASNVVAAPRPEEKPETGTTCPSGGVPTTDGEVRPVA